MNTEKRALLIAGGGTLGTYTAQELLRLGNRVDVVCLEDKTSTDDRLTFYRANASLDYLEGLLAENAYDGIVNFIHYSHAEDYVPYHKLLASHTDHLIFLSSYRVYADLERPITENAPRLLDVTDDVEFLETETYAAPKARCEDYLREKSGTKNWTVVRPVISFSERRFDLLMYSDREVLDHARQKKALILPEDCKTRVAGLDWAGNSGKLIANLLWKPNVLGEAYTVSSAQNLTWGEVAELYTELVGLRVEWVDEDAYVRAHPELQRGGAKYWAYRYDRKFDRTVDNRKILEATGLSPDDFTPIREGLQIELSRL